MAEAEAAFARAREDLAVSVGRTPTVRALIAGLAELRDADYFTERIEQAVRKDQGPAAGDHGH